MPLPVLAVLLYVSRVKLPATLAAALVSIAAASYHIYLLHRILPEALFDRANPATFTALLPVAVSVVSGLLSGILAYQLQRRIMLGQRLWAGLSRLGDYLRHLLADRGCRSDPLRLLQASSREVACHLDGPLRRANPHWRVALRDDSQYLATIDLTVKGKLYAH